MRNGRPQRGGQLIEAGAAIDPKTAAVLPDRRRALGVVLVANLAHDLFENVFARDESRRAAELVHDDRDVRRRALKVAELIVERLGFGDEGRRPDQGLPARPRLGQPHRDGHHVLPEHHARQVICRGGES